LTLVHKERYNPFETETINKGAAGIQVFCDTEGTVAEVPEKFKSGKLEKAPGANVEGLWV
jgi:hypothetical protein